MKVKLNYFTSTGNTLWAAGIIKREMEAEGHQVELYDSVLEKDKCVSDADLIGFVYPVWGSTLPDPQREIIGRMPVAHGQEVFLIGNAGVFSGDTGIYWKGVLEGKGYDVIYVNHVFLPINSNFPGFNMFRKPNSKKAAKMMRKAEDVLCRDTKNILSGVRRYKGKGLIAKIGGGGQRNNYDQIVLGFISEMYIDSSRCIGCGLCHRMCPQDAISKNEKGDYVLDTTKCIMCLKCYNFCPSIAALMKPESSNARRYKRYKGLNSSVKPVFYRERLK